jgi:hypothetical protein
MTIAMISFTLSPCHLVIRSPIDDLIAPVAVPRDGVRTKLWPKELRLLRLNGFR